MIRIAHFCDSLQRGMFRWSGAAAFAVALHVGLLALLLYSPESTDAGIAGTIAIDLAPITAGSPVELGDVPPGPLTPEQAATSEATKEVLKQELVKTPEVEPSPLAPNPEVSLPTRREEDQKPVEKEMDKQAERESQASVASLPTAPPRLDEKNSPVPTAPEIGLPAAALQVRASGEKTLVTHLNRYKRYPAGAHSHRVEGQVMVAFTVDRVGTVVASYVVHTSDSLVLDDEALAMLRRASPLPKPPAEAQGSTFEFVLPIRFKIQ